MPTCHHFAPNGKKSTLYQFLEKKYGPDKAHDIWTEIRTQQFLNKHGDWVEAGKVVSLLHKYKDHINNPINGEFEDDHVTIDPVTRQPFTGTGLMDHMIKVEKKDDINIWMGREFSERRGYSPEAIENFYGPGGFKDLRQQLVALLGQEKAIMYTAFIQNPNMGIDDALEEYYHDFKVKARFDVNGEPTLDWVEARAANKPVQSYIFPDGHKIDSPFAFTEDQKKTFDSLYKWYILDEKEPNNGMEDVFLIQGNAGTGKSSTIGFFMQYLIETGRVQPQHIGMSSPTHKANKVLFRFMMKLKAFGKNVFAGTKQEYNQQVFTTAAAFGVKVTVTNRQGMTIGQQDKKQKGYSKLTGSSSIPKKKIWIIDEISMLDAANKKELDSMVEALKFYNGEDIKIIMMGDDKQLTNQTTGKVSPFFHLKNKVSLKEEVRQSRTNPLLQTLAPIKTALDAKEKLPQLPSYKSEVNENGEGVIYTDTLSPSVLGLLKTPEYQKSRTHTKIIARSNAAVARYNEQARNFLFKAPRNLEVNDTLMGYQQIGKSSSEGTQNGQEYVIKEITYNKSFEITKLMEEKTHELPSKTRALVLNIIRELPKGESIGDHVKMEEDNPIFDTTIETFIVDANTDFHIAKIQNAVDVYSKLINGHVATQGLLRNVKRGDAKYFNLLDQLTAYETAIGIYSGYIQFKTPLYKDTTTGEVRSQAFVTELTEKHYEANKDKIPVYKEKYIDDVLSKRVFIDKTIDYGYAITVTKSQGSGYTYPIIDLNSIEGKNNFWYGHDNSNTLRNIYVAESRATKIAINVTSKGDTKDVVLPESNTTEPIIPVIPVPEESTEQVFTEFGTQYRFNDTDGLITGEFKQGKGNVWRPMAVKTAQSKYAQFHPETEVHQPSAATAKRMDAKAVYARVNKLDDPTTADGLALAYIAGGGKISIDSLNTDMYQRKGRRNGEATARDYVTGKGQSISAAAHTLWDNLPEHLRDNIDTQSIEDALADVIGTHLNRLEAAEAYLKQYDVESLVQEPPAIRVEQGLPSEEAIANALTTEPIPQKYKDKQRLIDGTEMRTRVPGRTSIQMVKLGERTQTTRSAGQFAKPVIGDLQLMSGDGQTVLVRVTSNPFKPNKADFDRYEGWADEQWERSSPKFTNKWFSYRFEYLGDVKNGKFIPKETQPVSTPVPGKILTPADYTNHSGGANGSDSQWDIIGRKHGVVNHVHYYHGAITPKGNKPLEEDEIAEGIAKVKQTYAVLGRPNISKYHSLHGRNWFQVKGADTVFAIGDIITPGQPDKPNTKGVRYTSKASKETVGGGTGYAVEMAIQAGKPVYVFNQNSEGEWGEINYKPVGWYTWDIAKNEFVPVDVPVLTKNFAGIGTRGINTAGRMAINAVYTKTFSEVRTETAPIVNEAIAGPTPITLGGTTKLSQEEMVAEIDKAFALAAANPEIQYALPYEALPKQQRYPNKYNTQELVNLLDREDMPANIILTTSLQKAMVNSYRRIIAGFKSGVPVEFIDHNRQAVLDNMSVLLIPKVLNDGTKDGFFAPHEQEQLVGMITMYIERLYRADPQLKGNAVIKAFQMIQKRYNKAVKEGNLERAGHFLSIYEQRVNVAKSSLQQLEGMGLHIDQNTLSKIIHGVNKLEPLNAIDNRAFETKLAENESETEPDDLVADVAEDQGQIAKDWSDNTFELDPRDTASARIKMFIGTLLEMDRGVYTIGEGGVTVTAEEAAAAQADPGKSLALAIKLNRRVFMYKNEKESQKLLNWLNTRHKNIPKANFVGEPMVASYEEVFRELLATLGNRSQKSTFEEFTAAMAAHFNPTIQQMAIELTRGDQSLKNEFMSVMMKQYQPFTMALYGTVFENGEKVYRLRPTKSNRANQQQVLIDHWQNQQKLSDITISNEKGERSLDVKRIKELWMPTLRFAQSVTDWTEETAPGEPTMEEWFVNSFGDILRMAGISVTDEIMIDLFNNPKKWTNSTSVMGLFAQKKDGTPSGFFSIFIMKSAGLLKESDSTDNIDDLITESQKSNPLFTEPTMMTKFARLVAKHTPVIYSQNHRNGEGKTVWDWGMNTKLSHQFREFSNPDTFSTFEERARKTTISANNYLLDYFTEFPRALEDVELSYLDALKSDWGTKGNTRGSLSDREQLLTSMTLFQNRGHGYNNRPKVAYMSLTHADKTMTPIFGNMPRFHMGLTGGYVPETVVGKMDSLFFRVFKAEYDRITKHANVDSGVGQYEKGKHLFYFIPDFNYDAMRAMVAEGFLTDKEFKSIWPAGERQLTQVIDQDKELKVINKVLERFIENRVASTRSNWFKHGIITDTGHMFDANYVRAIAKDHGLKYYSKASQPGKSITNYREGGKGYYTTSEGKILQPAEAHAIITDAAVRDYALNHFLVNTSMAQLFYGDPAEAYKAAANPKSELDHVNSSLVEYAKRLAKDIAPRTDMYWGENRTYRTITMSDVKMKESTLQNIRELAAAYGTDKINATDAQEFITVKEKLNILMAAGKINSTVYNEMMKIVENAKGGYYEFTNPDHLDVIMQPEKPVYAGQREPTADGIRLTDYVKSAAFPLYPPLTRDRELDKLRQLMETENIDRADFKSARKLGAPTSPVQVFDSEGNFIEQKDIKSRIQVMSRDGFGIQQELPYDPDKEAIKIVSQMNENLIEGILDMEGFEVSGYGTLSGRRLRQLKEAIRIRMINNSLADYKRKLNIDEFDNIDREAIFDDLVHVAKTDVRNSYTLNEIQSLLLRDEKGELKIPLAFNSAAAKFAGVLMNGVNRISDIKMPGKSYTQVSSVGMKVQTSESTDLSNIVWVNDYDGSNLKPLRIDENGVVQPGQIILPFNFFDADGNRLNVEDFLIERDGKKFLDPDRVPRELLQLVGARIPNQKHSSMHPLEIVGFAPANMGDIAIIPSAMVTQMGGDFDADKLFAYKRPYVYADGKFSVPVKEDYDTLEQMQLDYFNVHWAVLTHKDMVKRVMAPLDMDDLELESKRMAAQRDGTYNFFDAISQLEDFQSGKDAKRLVGSTSWGVKFHARIQNVNLRLGTTEYDPKTKTTTIVDDYILVKDEHTGEIRRLGRLSGTATSYYLPDGEELTDANREKAKRTKAENHVMVQNGAVDNAKNRFLDSLNLTPDTYKAVQAFIELQDGDNWAASTKYWTRLLAQPVIHQFSAAMKKGNDSFSEAYDPNLFHSVVKELVIEYSYAANMTPTDAQKLASGIIFDPQTLNRALNVNDPMHNIQQIAALNLFTKLYNVGKRMYELESHFNQDVSGAGKDLFVAMDKRKKLDQLEDNKIPINGAMDLFQKADGNLTEVGATFDATINTALTVVADVLPYDSLQPIFDSIVEKTGRNNLTWDQQRTVLKGFMSAVYSESTNWWNDPQADRVRLFYGDNSLGKRLNEAKLTWGARNPMLQRLDVQIGNDFNAPDFIKYKAASKALAFDKQNMTTGWLHLLLSENETERSLGEDLVRYAYLTGGIQDAISFVEFLPTAYLANTQMAAHLQKWDGILRTSDTLQLPGLVTQIIQHNPLMAQQIARGHFGKIPDDMDFPESFVYDGDETLSEFITYRSSGSGPILYVNNKQGETNFYTRIDVLGTDETDEYNGMRSGWQRSIFPENRGMAEGIPGLDGDNALAHLDNKSIGHNSRPLTNGTLAEELNLKSGGETELTNALKSIAEHKAVPEHIRLVAELFAKVEVSDEIRQSKSLTPLLYGKQVVDRLTILNDETLSAAGTSSWTGEVKINLREDANPTLTDLADTVVHEIGHNRLQWLVAMAGYDTRLTNRLGMADFMKFQEISVAFAKKHPGVIQRLHELEKLRYEGLNYLRNLWGEEIYNQISSDMIQRQNGHPIELTEDHIYYYSLSNLQEFVAQVPINPSLGALLNFAKTNEPQTFLERVWSALANILEAFAKELGIEIRNGSVLKAALTRVISLHDLQYTRDLDITSGLKPGAITTVASEQEAIDLAGLYDQTYNISTSKETDGLQWMVNHKFKKKAKIVPGHRGKVIAQLELQKKQYEDVVTRVDIDVTEQVILRAKLNEVREQIAELRQVNNINKIAEIGRKQLTWVDEIIAAEHPPLASINIALNTAQLWSGLIELLYGGLASVEENQDFTDIAAAATRKRIEVLNTRAKQGLTDYVAHKAKLTPLDYTEKMVDIGPGSAYALAMTRVKPMFTQAIATVVWESANSRDEAIWIHTKKLQDLEAKMKNVGLTTDMMIQMDPETKQMGLISQFSGEWFTFLSEQSENLEDSLTAIDAMSGIEDGIRKDKRKEAWKKYWKEMMKNAFFVDVRHLLDIETGERATGKEFKEEYEKLVKEAGSKELADTLIQQAQAKYKDYILQRDAMRASLESSIELTEEEAAGKSDDEKQALLDKKEGAAMNQWMQYNSPVDLLNRLESGSNINYRSQGNKWIVTIPKASLTKFHDPAYEKIAADPKKMEAFNEYKAILEEMISYLPMEIQRKLSANFLPIVPKDTANLLANVMDKIKNWDVTTLKMIAATDAEQAARERPNQIPVMYTRAFGQTEEVVNRSTDLIRVLELFSMMAMQHKFMSSALDAINVAENVMKNTEARRAAGQETGQGLRNTIDALQYLRDATIFKKPVELQAKIDSPLYSTDMAKQAKILKEIKGLLKEKAALNKAMSEKMDEDDFFHEAEETRIAEIDKILIKYEADARHIYGSKLVDLLININQMKALSYNPFSASANLTFALVSLTVQAQGRIDFTPRTLNQAFGVMTHAMKKYWMFSEHGDDTAQKVHNLMNRAGIMGDVVDTEYGESNVKNRKHSKFRKSVQPFAWQRAGDYFTKGTLLVAMMKHKKVKVMDAGTGKEIEISLWDAMDKDGNWDAAKYGENKEWSDRGDVTAQKKWNPFRDKVRKVSMITFGNQDKNAPMMAKKNWVLRLASQFRLSWLPEGFAVRFKDEYTDINLERKIKGRFRTIPDLGFVNVGIVMARQLLSSLPGVQIDPFENVTLKDGTPLSESAVDIENMRKNFAGLAWTTSLAIAILMLRALGDDEHKKSAEGRRRQLLINLLIRNEQDLMLYSSPAVFNTISGNFLPATQVIVDYAKAMRATAHYLFDSEEDRHAFETWFKKITRAGLPYPTFTLYNKIETMLTRDLDKLQR